MQQINLIEDYPAKIAELLLSNKIDIALVPVAILPQLKNYYLISNYCIGAINEVASVSLFSNVSIYKIKTILLDYQSRTSVALTKILCKEYWKIDVEFVEATEGYINQINNTTAAVVIGDRALQIRNKFQYNYDLAIAWKTLTNLPFVFATWVANKPIEQNFIAQFDQAMQVGLQNIEAVIAEQQFSNDYDLKTYFTQNISYQFDEEKKKALQLFLQKLNSY